MSIELLRIHNARSLFDYSLTPHPYFNIIYGPNGAGKTTILESIYLLLRSRTFRSTKYKSFINDDALETIVYSKFSDSNKSEKDFTLGISRSRNTNYPVIHLNKQKIHSLSDITCLAILGLITPESFNLLDSGPAVRRKFIDWGVFHVEPNFLSSWRSYKKILSNRNIILKKLKLSNSHLLGQTNLHSISCWDHDLIHYNNILHNFRSKQLDNIKPIFFNLLSKFSTDLVDNISLDYYQGWNQEVCFEDYLKKKLPEDLSAGITRYGTHRSELKIMYKKNSARDILSRGQKKLVVICLILAQFVFLKHANQAIFNHILLLDDIDSELDINNLSILFSLLEDIKSQVFISTTDKERFKFLSSDFSMFHVEPNKISNNY